MNAPALLSRRLPEPFLPWLRDLINDCIANGIQPNMELELLDPDVPEAPKDMPPARPGTRFFRVGFGLPPGATSGQDWQYVIAVADNVPNDKVTLVRSDLCAWIAAIEQHQAVPDVSGHSLVHRRMPLWEQRETGRDLTEAAADTNAVLDTVREAMADPRSWPPIRDTAVLVAGFYICTRVHPDGRVSLLVIEDAAEDSK